MKHQNRTAQMLGQIIEPATGQLEKATVRDNARPRSRYEVTEIIGQEIGKRTFLATDLNSQNKVVLKLVLFCPDLVAEEEEQAQAEQAQAELQPQATSPTYELTASFPYLESFEVDTPLGEGLVLVKPYIETPPFNSQHQEQRPYTSFNSSGDRTISADITSTEIASTEIASTEMASAEMAAAEIAASDKKRDRTPTQSNIITTFQNPTPRPLNFPQLVYLSFRVRPTQHKLEIQFPEARVREGLKPSDSSTTLTQSVELWLSVILSTVVFVGGIVVATNSILAGVIVAAIIPLVFQKLVGPSDTERMATLRLTTESGGRTFLSLTTMLPPVRDRKGQINGAPRESILHGSRLSIKNVKVSPTLMLISGRNPLMAQLSFTFHNHNTHAKRLRIVGSYQEIRWVSHHLAQWGNQRNVD